MVFTYFLQMIVDNIANISSGGIYLSIYNNAFMLRCVLLSKIIACVKLSSLQTWYCFVLNNNNVCRQPCKVWSRWRHDSSSRQQCYHARMWIVKWDHCLSLSRNTWACYGVFFNHNNTSKKWRNSLVAHFAFTNAMFLPLSLRLLN